MPHRYMPFVIEKHVLTTRDCIRYKPLLSPIAPIALELFKHINNPEVYKSLAYAATPQGQTPPSLVPPEKLPNIVVIQGSFRPDLVLHFDGSPPTDPAQLGPNGKTPDVPKPEPRFKPDSHDIIIVPLIFHKELLRAIEEENEEEINAMKIMITACLLHELGHWYHTKFVGFTPDNERPQPSYLPKEQKLEKEKLVLLGRRPVDVGIKVTSHFLGAHFEIICWTSGQATVVKRHIIENEDDTSGQNLLPIKDILGINKLPNIVDVTDDHEERACPSDLAGWDQSGVSEIVLNHTGPNAMCHHGSTRL